MSNERDQVILEMCVSYRPDYHVVKLPTDPPWLVGMTDFERQGLWRTMADIYDNQIKPKTNNEKTTTRKRKNRYKRKMG